VAAAGVAGALLPLANLPGLRRIPVEQTLLVVGFAVVASLLVSDLVKTALIRATGLTAPSR